MALSDAMSSSVMGIKSQSNAMSTVSDNVANMRTVSYKEARNRFSTLTTSSNSRTGYQAGGVKNVVKRMVDQGGALETSNSQTAMAIHGKGMFVVGSSPINQTQMMFSRAGDFNKDAQGYLKNTAGSFLYGLAVDSTGTPINNTGTVNDLVPVEMQDWVSQASETQNMTLALNLSSQSDTGATFTVNQTVFDSVGSPHDLQLAFVKNSDSPPTWLLTVTSADGTLTRADTNQDYKDVLITFDDFGRPSKFGSSSSSSTAEMPSVVVDWNADPALVSQSKIALNLGTLGKVDGLTSLAGASNVTKRTCDGYPAGQFTAFDIDQSGMMRAYFDNQTNMPVYQIPLAVFNNPRGLTAVSGNNYLASIEAGPYVLQNPQNAGAGVLLTGTLESSTVDVTTEFAEMVATQQAFSANVQAFQAGDEMYRILERLRT